MFKSVPINAIALALALAVATLSAHRQQATVVSPNLAKFHAKTPEQQVKAESFDNLRARPLRPNIISTEDFEQAGPPRSAPEYGAYLRETVCEADLVAFGRPLSHESFLTDHETSIFTDYSFGVDQWLRGSVTFDRPVASTAITVTLRGGKIETDAGPIEVQNEDPLTTDQRYVVFLKRIPQTTSYRLSAPTLVAASVATSMKGKRDIPEPLLYGDKTTATLIADIQRISGACGARGVTDDARYLWNGSLRLHVGRGSGSVSNGRIVY